jgi:hypothetical protein
VDPAPHVLAGYEAQEVVAAKDQQQYQPLPILAARTPSGKLSSSGIRLSRWTFTPEERAQVARDGEILLYQYTFNEPLQPVYLQVVVAGDERSVANVLGLEPDAGR